MTEPTAAVASKTSKTFRMECAVRCSIAAPPATIWALLTNAADFPRWNSTVTSIDGDIALGNKLALKVPSSPRTFTPKVTAFEPGVRMVWSDGMAPMFKGTRTFTLTPRPDGATEFAMVEVFAGVMLPMLRGSLPDFGPVFEQYARDLEREAVRVWSAS
ncbi:MAG: SRPBCC domain-containing protein [Deltaproteobacteria bacterium]|nr:SRPBCC domain-containing protein [Deltaproteobacteria bacterium]